mgnify:CR=1 FL=1
MEEERRKMDAAAHAEILTKLSELTRVQEISVITQKNILGRLDAMNGSVKDYNDNKYKRDLAYLNIETNRIDHSCFLSTKSFNRAAIILGALVVAAAVLNLFGINIGG